MITPVMMPKYRCNPPKTGQQIIQKSIVSSRIHNPRHGAYDATKKVRRDGTNQ